MNVTLPKTAAREIIVPDEEPAAPVVISETVALLNVIERAARDPSVDIDKMERLIAMRDRIESRRAKADFDAALAEMQAELPVIEERGEIKISQNSKGQSYALWEDINEAIKPVLAQHGFAISFRTGEAENRVTVTGILSHRGGHREETTMKLPVDTSGSKNAVQAVGSSTSYGKRYTAAALLNLTSRLADDKDDDGVAAMAAEPISAEQLAELQKLADEVSADVPKFCAYLKVVSLAAIPKGRFKQAVDALNAKRAK